MKTVLGQFYENNEKEKATKTAVAKSTNGKAALKNNEGKGETKMHSIVEKYPYQDLQILNGSDVADKFKYVRENQNVILNSTTIMEADDIAFIQSITGKKISHECYKYITDGKGEGVNFDLSDFKSLSVGVKTQDEINEDKAKIQSICKAVDFYYKNHEQKKHPKGIDERILIVPKIFRERRDFHENQHEGKFKRFTIEG